jgi:hypothetical protein
VGNAYINTNIEIPNVHVFEPMPDYLGDDGRTVNGTYRSTVTAEAKRFWKIQGRLLTSTQRNAIYNYLVSIGFGACSFWLYTFGGAAATDSVTCYVKIESDTVSVDRQFTGASGFENEPHDMTFMIREQEGRIFNDLERRKTGYDRIGCF